MRTIKQATTFFNARSRSLARKFHRIIAITSAPLLIAFSPLQAWANEAFPVLPTQGTRVTIMLIGNYLHFPAEATSTDMVQGVLSHAVARGLVIGALLAIFIAMIVGASYLWRENVNHLRADSERKKSEALDIS